MVSHKMQIVSLALAGSILLYSTPSRATDDVEYMLGGLPTNHVFDLGTFDNIDIYTRFMNFSIPLFSARVSAGFSYTLGLSYSSDVYKINATSNNWKLSSVGPFGVGFRAHMGRLYKLTNQRWFYEDATGTSHRLHDRMVNGSKYFFTKDSSFIRAQKLKNGAGNLVGWHLWLPDGTLYEFEYEVTLGNNDLPKYQGWYTTAIRASIEPAQNYVLVTYDPTNVMCIQSISDSVGRQITFSNSSTLGGADIPGGYTESVTVPAWNGTTGTYSFTYNLRDVWCFFDACGSNKWANDQALLSRIEFPENGIDLNFDYTDQAVNVYPETLGVITGITLPTGASISYWHQPPDEVQTHYQILSVNTRTVSTPDGQTFVRTYEGTKCDPGSQCDFRNTRNVDVYLETGNLMRYRYQAHKANDPGDNERVREEGMLLDVRTYLGSALDNTNLLRTESLTYVYDEPGSGGVPGWDIRIDRHEITYHDDNNSMIRTEWSEWDGAHWKTEKHYDFDGSILSSRTTEYDLALESDPEWSRWVLTSKKSDSVYDPNGVLFAKTVYVNLPDGRLQTERRQINPGSMTPVGDQITTIGYDGSGNPCHVSVSDDESDLNKWGITYSYEWGMPKSVQVDGVGWPGYLAAIDKNTGLVSALTQTNGLSYSYSYDSMRRLTSIVPPAPEEPTILEYPDIMTNTIHRGDEQTVSYVWQQQKRDSLGRPIEERRRLDTSAIVKRVTEYLENTKVVSFASEWQYSDTETPEGTYFDYLTPLWSSPQTLVVDPLGRTAKTTSVTDDVVEYTYQGTAVMEKVYGINNSSGTVAETTSVKDGLGRATDIVPPIGGANAHYEYDPVGHVVRMESADGSGAGTTQVRTRVYDPLGRLLESREPESGVTRYTEYDHRARPHKLIRAADTDDEVVLTYSYDNMDRVTAVARVGNQGELIPVFESYYDDTGDVPGGFGYSTGQLVRQVSFDQDGDETLREDFFYSGIGGRLNETRRVFRDWDPGGGPTTLGNTITFDDFGMLSVQQHPGAASDTPTEVAYTYSHGWLNSISSDKGSIVAEVFRSPSGSISSLLHANGLTTSYSPDSRNRVERMTVSAGATTLYDSGTLSYDGRENVTAVGPSTYEYDLLGRLISASVSTSSVPVDVYDLQYTYDPWGNLRDITKGVGGGSSIRSAVIDETSNQVESVNGTEWDVDSSGNVKSDGVLSYSWDAMGRLTAVANDSLPLVENEYDARGAKIRLRDYAEYRDTFYIRNYSGLVLSEYARPIDSTQPPEWSRDYVYADGSAVAVIMNSAPLEPAGISSWATGSAVFLSWMASSEIDHYGYHVYRASSPEGPFVRINTTGTVLGTQFTDADPLQGPPGTGLPGYYAIAAVDNAGTQSRYSSVRQITMGDATPPATPYGVQASTSSQHVGLSWAGGIESDFAGYDVYRSLIPTAQGGSFSKRNSYPLQSPSFSDNSVSNGVAYYYKIVSLDTAGNMSGFSSEISATPTGGGGGGGPCPPAGCIPYKEAYLYLRDCPSEEQAPRSPGEFWPCLRSSPTELLASAGNDYELRHLHLDHVGSVRASSDANGQVISKVDYLPFGEVIDAEATGEDRLRFNGYEVIPAIGKDYSYYRYYDWLSGRFLSPDPQSYMDGMQDPQHYNRYAFAANNPLTFSDPEGAAFRVSFGSTGVQIALDFLGHELNVNIAMNSDGGLTIVPLRGPLTPEQQKRQDLLMDISADPRVINLHLFDAGSDFIFYGATSSNGHALIDVADAKALDAVSNNTDFQPGVMMLHEMVEAAVKINAGARVQQLKSALDLAGKKYDAHVLTVFLGAPGLGNPTVVNFKRPIWPAPGAPVTLVEYGLTVTTPKKQTLWSLMILNPPWTHVPGQIGWKSGRILSTRGKQ